MEEIAELLRTARQESGIEIKEASKDLEINELYLKNIEDGKIGSFKDIFELKEYLTEYSKYLGVDEEKINDYFNEYIFEYTSKIPIKEIEKTIKNNSKDDDQEIGDKIVSPYTVEKVKSKKLTYITIYLLILVMVILAIIWSVNQITIDKRNAYVASYKE